MNARTVPLALLLLLAVAATLTLRSRVGPSEIAGLVPVVRESRVPLVLRLDEAEQAQGFPDGTDWRAPFTDPFRNVDADGIPFLMPPTGALVFRDLPAHEDARLTFEVGFDGVSAPEFEGVAVDFVVLGAAGGGGEPRELYRERLAATAAPTRVRGEARLPAEWRGGLVDLRLETACERVLPDASVLPVFASPVLRSNGTKVRMENATLRTVRLVADLVARYDDARERLEDADDWEWVAFTTTREQCFAVRIDEGGDERPPIPISASGRTPAFETDARMRAARGGVLPALYFQADHEIARYPIDDVPPAARLDFSIGVDHRCVGVGTATFRVTADGETVFEERLDPGTRPEHRGWLPRSVDLSPFAGRSIELSFQGEVAVRGPRTVELTETPPLGAPIPYRLEVRRVMGGFGRPRIVEDVVVSRRLAEKERRPSVVFVNVETFRADEPSCYGGLDGLTPALDRLAAEGTRVEECVTAAPWTSPSVASFFTGLHPWSHGVTSYAQSRLSDSVVTLAERAAAAGVTTFGVSTNDLISVDKGFDQGFEAWLDAPWANARQVVATFEDWLADHRDFQFLAYLHLFEPHHPLNAPGADLDRYVPDDLKHLDPEEELARIQGALLAGEAVSPDDPGVRLLRGLYRGEVRYLDRQLERLVRTLEAAGLRERVVVVVTGDHGEEFCEHGLIGHGSHLYGESVLVPLVFWGPGIVPRGNLLAGPVENVQLHATVLDLLGLDVPREEVGAPLLLDRDGGGGRAYTSTEQGIREIDLSGERPAIFTKTIHGLRTRRASLVHS
ncbi:MAG: sulfatase, partial [Planctomycetota bacterium JB042]